MNLLAALAPVAPGFIDAVLDRTRYDNWVPLVSVLDTLLDFGEAWDGLQPLVDQELPPPPAVRGAVDRLPDRLREDVEAAHLLRVDPERWAAWVSNAQGEASPSRWVQYVEGSAQPGLGIAMPQDSDVALNIAGFQHDPGRLHPLLLPLRLHVGTGPPYVHSVEQDVAAGCEMDDDGECVHDDELCSGSCGLTEIFGQSRGTSLACRCHV